jgi:hypothetical protein
VVTFTNILKHYVYVKTLKNSMPIMHYIPLLVHAITTSFLFLFGGGSVFPTRCTTLLNKALINLHSTNKAICWNTLVTTPITSKALLCHIHLDKLCPSLIKILHNPHLPYYRIYTCFLSPSTSNSAVKEIAKSYHRNEFRALSQLFRFDVYAA